MSRLEIELPLGAAFRCFMVLAPLCDVVVLVNMGRGPDLGWFSLPFGQRQSQHQRAGQ